MGWSDYNLANGIFDGRQVATARRALYLAIKERGDVVGVSTSVLNRSSLTQLKQWNSDFQNIITALIPYFYDSSNNQYTESSLLAELGETRIATTQIAGNGVWAGQQWRILNKLIKCYDYRHYKDLYEYQYSSDFFSKLYSNNCYIREVVMPEYEYFSWVVEDKFNEAKTEFISESPDLITSNVYHTNMAPRLSVYNEYLGGPGLRCRFKFRWSFPKKIYLKLNGSKTLSKGDKINLSFNFNTDTGSSYGMSGSYYREYDNGLSAPYDNLNTSFLVDDDIIANNEVLLVDIDDSKVENFLNYIPDYQLWQSKADYGLAGYDYYRYNFYAKRIFIVVYTFYQDFEFIEGS